jgi:ATP/ADP translocase
MLKMNINENDSGPTQTPQRHWLWHRVTGAYSGELAMVVSSFLALFCLQSSYYLVKPLRNSQFLKEFPPEYLPLVYLTVSLISFVLTKLFSWLYAKLEKKTLLNVTFIAICLCKLAFTLLLPTAGKALTVVFFMWGSVYFLLVLSATWGCINDLFRADQSERCFGFVATGNTLGCILGSKLASNLAAWGPNVLLLASGFLLTSLGALQYTRVEALRLRALRTDDPDKKVEQDRPKQSNAILAELKLLLGNRYLMCLATMVTCLAIYTTGIDFISQQQMDRGLAQRVYAQTFTQLEAQMTASNKPDQGFAFIFSLREVPKNELESTITNFANSQGVPAQQLVQDYKTYKEDLNKRTRQFFSDTFLYQGISGAFVLTFLCPWLFGRVGVSKTVLIFPLFALIGLLCFSVPLSVEVIQVLLVMGGTLNYSLNNATKEVLYTVTSTEEKYRIKPMIEGPCMRLGDMVASVVSLTCAAIVKQSALPTIYKDYMYLVFCSICVVVWLRAIWAAGKEYRARRKANP